MVAEREPLGEAAATCTPATGLPPSSLMVPVIVPVVPAAAGSALASTRSSSAASASTGAEIVQNRKRRAVVIWNLCSARRARRGEKKSDPASTDARSLPLYVRRVGMLPCAQITYLLWPRGASDSTKLARPRLSAKYCPATSQASVLKASPVAGPSSGTSPLRAPIT